MPVRILVFKNAKGWTSPAPLTEGRDRYAIVLDEKSPVPPAIYSELTRLLPRLQHQPHAGRLRARTDRVLLHLRGQRHPHHRRRARRPIPISIGRASICWWSTPEYFGKLRVLLYNLRKGVDDDAAYRNAFGKSAAEIEAQAKQHLAAGNFQTTSLSPASPWRRATFTETPVSDTDLRLARADLLAGAQSAAEYQSLLARSSEGAGSRRGPRPAGPARSPERRGAPPFRRSPSRPAATSARCYIEYARLEPDDEKADQALLKAAGINPKLDEPFALMAQRDTDPRKRLMHWKAAAERDPRNASYWQALAECYLADHNYAEAAKAWREAEQAATDPPQRERMHQARAGHREQRLDYEAAEKQRQAEEDAREIAKLKDQARAELHAAEAKYNGDAKPDRRTPCPWWDGPHAPGKIVGTLKQVDCLGKQARLVVEGDDHKTVKLLVSDPGKIVDRRRRSAPAGMRRAEAAPRHHRIFPQGQCPAGDRGRSGHHRVPVTARTRRRGPLSLVVLAVFVLSSAINYLDRQTLATLAPLLRADFHLSREQYGWILGAFSITYAASAPFAGMLIDRIGLTRGISLAVGLWSCAGIATGFTRGLGGLVGCRAVLGVAEAGGIPAAGKAIHQYLRPPERALGNAVNQAGVSLGAILAPPLATWIALRYGWRMAFVVTGILGLVWIPAVELDAPGSRLPFPSPARQRHTPNCCATAACGPSSRPMH